MKDLHSNIQLARALSPINVGGNDAQVSQIIDRAGFDALTFAILTGVLSDSNAEFTVLVEHDDASGFGTAAAVPDTKLIGTEAGASFSFDDDNKQIKISYIGEKRYVRMTITPSGNAAATATTVIAVVAILGHPRTAPKSAQVT